MADNDGVVADQNLLDDEAHDSLALDDVKRIGGAAQSCEERRKGLCQAQEHGAVVGLVGDRLQLGAQCVLPLAQRRHALTQLLERDEFFLIGAEQPFDAVGNTSQFSLRALFALFRGIGSSCRREAAVEFVLDQRSRAGTKMSYACASLDSRSRSNA